MPPKRIQQRRTLGWRMPPNTVSVGRPSRWGNTFRVGALYQDPGPWDGPACPYDGQLTEGVYRDFTIARVRDRLWAVALFGPYIRFHDDVWRPEVIAFELGGRDLACWCPVGEPCHADVLLEIANSGEAPHVQ